MNKLDGKEREKIEKKSPENEKKTQNQTSLQDIIERESSLFFHLRQQFLY
jgi:hypothetical protein